MLKWSVLMACFLLSACTTSPKTAFSDPLETSSWIDNQRAAELNVALGLAYLERLQFVRAKDKLNHAQALAPNLSLTHYAMGSYWEQVGALEEAEQAYKKAIQLNPRGKEYNYYGAFLCRLKQYDVAEQQFLKAMQDVNYTDMASVFENAGLCALQNHQFQQGKQYLDQAIQRDPKKAEFLKKYMASIG